MKNQQIIWLMLVTLAFWLIFVVVHLLLLVPDHKSSGTDLLIFYGSVLAGMELLVVAFYLLKGKK